ncbi:peptide/nickel transport system substrate-binding protein [Saccharicrinis carchari]|uniref:Peptide/nickel transport system substrate-binding protein n=1 Tax=Saccharicrinis carchari TaxID=1168039 RepID=A0A521AEF5_SACCC|nr:ABC transporter substrate-binding protein [Saccharicrinis carchari]SMO33194.1 peptide/nickel transport system substrate-binding protein [Saccharicrinis carchari]
MMERNISLVFWLLLSVLIGSCVNQDKTKQDGAEERKKTLILAIGGEPDNGFDPTTGWGQYASPLFQSTLLKYDKDFNIENDAAIEYEISDDGLKWTVKLRDNIQFSDGKPLTAKDVVFTFTTAKQSASVVDLTNLREVEQLDDFTVRFTLKKRNSTFIHHLTSLGIVPEHAYDALYNENPVGSGPYQLVQWDKGQQLILTVNPYYYGKAPFFEELVFLFLSQDAAFAAAKAGQVDVASVTPALADKKIKGMKLLALKSVDNRGVALPFVSEEGRTDNGHPIGNRVTSDEAIRKAMNIGVDREALVKGVLRGYGTPAYSIADGLPWWNPQTKIENDGNIKKAKEILEEAGWREEKDGIRYKNGIKAAFTLYYPSNDQIRQSLSIAFAQMMKPLGIQVEIKGDNWRGIEKQVHANATLFGLGSHDPLELYNAFSSEVSGRGLNNPNYYANDTVDAYFVKALAATSQDEANAYWKKAQWDGVTGFSNKGDAPWVWLVNLDHLFFMRENLVIGPQKIQPHDHNWPVTDFIENWHWKE